ncbi:bacillolysin [Mangrovimonas yunxiaonensis]|uniref:Bacillolysin n=1 Tax=Mangrovimonas yunxiaonensis TaxID=1197477 RepID=A0A084TNL4_9FLAO|nr:M4 family metallopeptidase [Mangrovimonas yunxiaonensis]KFB02300.1 bacillolysin [Mangrovimonas yunxiaonensis]
MKKMTIATLFLALLCFTTVAQEKQKALKAFETETKAKISLNTSSENIEFITFPTNSPLKLEGATIQAKTIHFLQQYKTIFGFEALTQTFKAPETKLDNYGFKQVVLKQQHHNIPVFDGQLRFHFNAEDQLTSINGNIITVDKKLNTTPTLSSTQATAIALQEVDQQAINHSGHTTYVYNTSLFIFQKGLIQNTSGPQHLVYEIEVRNDKDVRELLYIDAHTGQIVEQFTGIAHAINRTVHETNIGNVVWQEGDALPGSLSIWQQNEVIAAGHMYHFFNNAFGFASFNGNDGSMVTLNNSTNFNCPNARWNGSFVEYCDGTASDDVVAHEWGHAYTQYTSGLIYAYQSGAINEAYSDIWGETIDLLNAYEDTGENLLVRTSTFCNSDRWKIGEDASSFGGAIRDMWNPPCNGDPGKVTDTQYLCGEADNGGVHINSGIPNHAYALLVDGGGYNGYTITGIGFTKAAHIFWRAQSAYLTPTSDFSNLADALEAACTDLIGINLEGLSTTDTPAGLSGETITSADYNQLVNAILAVELRIEPDFCGYEPILATTDAPCSAAENNPIFFEDWENGLGNWTVDQLPEDPATWETRDWEIVSVLPENRAGQAIFGTDPINGDCSSSLQNGILRLESPIITLPDYTEGNIEMSFMHYVATENLWDGANIKYRLNNGDWTLLPTAAFTVNGYNNTINNVFSGNDNPMAGEDAFTGTDGGTVSGSWGRSYIDLSFIGAVANTSIQFRFEVGTDGCNGREGWFIDDIAIYNCSYPLSVNSPSQQTHNITVFPNPSYGAFTLKNSNALKLIKADIYDLNGRVVKTIDLRNTQGNTPINISNVASGMYFIKVEGQHFEQVIKLVKE